MEKNDILLEEKNLESDYFNKRPDYINYRREYFRYADTIDSNNNIDEYIDYTEYLSQISIVYQKKPYYFFAYGDNGKNIPNKNKSYVKK